MFGDCPWHGAFALLYLIVLLGVGALKARKIKSQEDFSLAGRGLSVFVLSGTLLATWIGTGSIFGNAEKTYEIGAAAFLLPIAGGAGILALYGLAARLRRFGAVHDPGHSRGRASVSAARVIWRRWRLSSAPTSMIVVVPVPFAERAGAARRSAPSFEHARGDDLWWRSSSIALHGPGRHVLGGLHRRRER